MLPIMRTITPLVLVTAILTSCAFTRVGAPALRNGPAGIPHDLTPRQAVKLYGIPDLAYEVGTKTLWVYESRGGFYLEMMPVITVLSMGSHRRREILLEFEDDRLTRASEASSGHSKSLGLLGKAYPGMIAR